MLSEGYAYIFSQVPIYLDTDTVINILGVYCSVYELKCYKKLAQKCKPLA